MNPLQPLRSAPEQVHNFSALLGQLAARLRAKAMPTPFGDVLNHMHKPATPRQEAMDKMNANLMVKDAGI